ncbi:MAG: hypothetical protein ABW068_06255, partial [Candidatus Thiodiazotropha sp.]
MDLMKQLLRAAMLLSLLASAQTWAEDQPATGEALKQQTYELLGTLKDYTLQQKDELMDALEQGMDDLDERIDALQERIDARCQPGKAKRRLVVPGSREAILETRRAVGA